MAEAIYEVKINTTRSDLADGAVMSYQPLRDRAFITGGKITTAIENRVTTINGVDHPKDSKDLEGYLIYWNAHDMTDLSHENPYELFNGLGQVDRRNRPKMQWDWMREFYERVADDGMDCMWGLDSQKATSIIVVRFDPDVLGEIRDPEPSISRDKHLKTYDYASHASVASLVAMRNKNVRVIRSSRNPNWNANEKAWADDFADRDDS